MSRFFTAALAVAVAASAALALTAAVPAHAAAAKVVATPGQVDLGSLQAGAKTTLTFLLENQGTAEAKKITCKGSGFSFDKKSVNLAAGAKETITATYTAAKSAPAKAKAVTAKISCGAAAVAVKGSLQPKAAAEVKPADAKAAEPTPAGAKPAEAKPADGQPEAKAAKPAGVKAKNAPDKVTIRECQANKPPVVFPHKEHAIDRKLACETCHHTQKGLKAGSDTLVHKCASCHLDPTDKAPSCKEKGTSKNPYHIRCLGCHKEKGGDKAPTKCAACHKS